MGLKYRRQGYRFAHDVPGDCTKDDDIGDVAEAAAEDYWCNRDGWETAWPVTFEILADGEVIATREVAAEMEPVFNAAAHNAKVSGAGTASAGLPGYTAGDNTE